MLEKMIEKHLTQTTKKYGGTTIKNNDPNKAGMPDRLILLPRGKHAFAEIKAPGKKPRPLQARQIQKLKNLGHKVYIIDTKQKAEQAIHEIHTT